jgi:protein involved in polysaccharide export with SLBB domain
VVSAQSTAITVLGEVRRPGSFPLQKQTRVVEALGTSGGTTIFANLDEIRVVRSTGPTVEVIPVNLDAIRDGDLATNVVLEQGDVLYVPPTVLAKIGYAVQAVLFPIQPALGIANSTVGSALAGGL